MILLVTICCRMSPRRRPAPMREPSPERPKSRRPRGYRMRRSLSVEAVDAVQRYSPQPVQEYEPQPLPKPEPTGQILNQYRSACACFWADNALNHPTIRFLKTAWHQTVCAVTLGMSIVWFGLHALVAFRILSLAKLLQLGVMPCCRCCTTTDISAVTNYQWLSTTA